MKCMHCLVSFHPQGQTTFIGRDADEAWAVTSYSCPACGRLNLFLVNYDSAISVPYGYNYGNIVNAYPIRPKGASRRPCPPEVPSEVASEYTEACLVLPDSAKASAALSRRCLQNVLREKGGVKRSDLSSEIQQVIDSGKLPTYLVEVIDAVRNIGNFAAHPIKSKSTGEIVPVEVGEAEWNLDVLESLFDFYYVQPETVMKRREALDRKLRDAGKPPMR